MAVLLAQSDIADHVDAVIAFDGQGGVDRDATAAVGCAADPISAVCGTDTRAPDRRCGGQIATGEMHPMIVDPLDGGVAA